MRGGRDRRWCTGRDGRGGVRDRRVVPRGDGAAEVPAGLARGSCGDVSWHTPGIEFVLVGLGILESRGACSRRPPRPERHDPDPVFNREEKESTWLTPSSTSQPATRPLYAGVGVTDRAVEAVRGSLAQSQKRINDVQADARQIDLDTVTREAKARRAAVEARITELQKSVQSVPSRIQARITAELSERELTYGQLVDRGETLVERIRRQGSTQDDQGATPGPRRRRRRPPAPRARRLPAPRAARPRVPRPPPRTRPRARPPRLPRPPRARRSPPRRPPRAARSRPVRPPRSSRRVRRAAPRRPAPRPGRRPPRPPRPPRTPPPRSATEHIGRAARPIGTTEAPGAPLLGPRRASGRRVCSRRRREQAATCPRSRL